MISFLNFKLFNFSFMAFNWQDIKTKATPYLEKITPLVNKAKDLGGKAVDFTGKQLQNTPIVLKNEEEFETLKKEKRFILIATEDGSKEAQEILLRSPIWSTIVWTENASLRFLSLSTTPEFARNHDFTGPISMKVYWNGEVKHSFSDIESIKKWWENRDYDGGENQAPEAPVSSELKETVTLTESPKTPEPTVVQTPKDPLV